MIKFDNTMLGRQVRFINAKAHEEMPECYPSVGTVGFIVSRSTDEYVNSEFLIQWPMKSTSWDDRWECAEDSLELVEEIVDYTPEKYGVVTAIRIFLISGHSPYATLTFAHGGTTTIDWAKPSERCKYKDGINGYTLFFDDRPKMNFEDYVKVRDNYD